MASVQMALLVPWQNGKPVTWDVTVVTTLAEPCINTSATSAATAAETAATRKAAKYVTLPNMYAFQPIALETLGPMNVSAVDRVLV